MLASALWVSWGPLRLEGHDEKISSSEIVVLSNRVIWKVDVGIAGLQKVVPFPASGPELSESQLDAVSSEIARFLASSISVRINHLEISPLPTGLEPIYEPFLLTQEPYIARVRQTYDFRFNQEIRELRLDVRLFEHQTKEHRAVLNVRWGDRSRQFVRVGPAVLELSYARVNPTFWNTAAEFLRWGANHIFIGYDHITFLLALLLAARRLREMVLIVTSFTVAHSLTLLLAALEILRVRPTITEALIAGSIVYVALENYFLKNGAHRWILAFVFGLVHGLGFSSVLRERLTEVARVALPIFSFNLGVEAGQIVILLAAFPLILFLRRGPDETAQERRYRLLLRVGSAPIMLLGLGWMIERIFGLEFMPL